MGSSFQMDDWYIIETAPHSENSDLSIKPVAELGIFIPQGSTRESFDLGVELRCSPIEIDEEKISFTLGLRKAELRVLLTNCVIPAGTPRLGDHQPPPILSNEVRREFETQEEQSRSSGLEGLTAVDSKQTQGKLAANIRKSSRGQNTSKESRIDEEEVWFVRSSTGNTWTIQDPIEGWLCRKYLGDLTLCHIKPTTARFKVCVQISTKARDLEVDDIEQKTWFRTLSINKQKIIKRVLAKIHLFQENESGAYTLGSVKMRSIQEDVL